MTERMKIGKKLTLAFVGVALVSSVAGIIGAATMYNMDSRYRFALSNYGFSQGDVGMLISEMQGVRVSASEAIVQDANQQAVDTSIQTIESAPDTIQSLLDKIKPTLISSQEQAAFNTIEQSIPQWLEAIQKAVDMGKDSEKLKNDAALEIINAEVMPVYDQIYQAANTLMALKMTDGNTVSGSLNALSRIMLLAVIVLVAVSLVLGLLLGTSSARKLTKPILMIESASRQLAEGNLDVEIAYHSKTELGSLADSMRETIQSLRNYVNEIERSLGELAKGNLNVQSQAVFKGSFIALEQSIQSIAVALNKDIAQLSRSAEQVASGSNQVSSGSQALAQGATEQASSVEELAATINEISAQVKNTAEHANQAGKKMDETSAEVDVCNRQMQQMVEAMAEITESSNEIGKIIKTIEDIAFQTNILALNAAVEAARAGAAGKGFAVVADEVRNLASKSAEAAKNTTALIEGSIKAVEHGTQIVGSTAESLNKVIESTQYVDGLVEKISHAANEQANSVTQVTQGVDQISGVVQTNSATAEQSAAAAQELSSHAQLLKQLVSHFQLKNESVQEEAVPESILTYTADNDKY